MIQKEQTSPLLYDAKGDLSQNWFVYYYKDGKRVRIYGAINKGKSTEERYRTAKILIENIKERQRLTYRSKKRRIVDKWLESKKNFWREKTYRNHKTKVDIFFHWLGFDEFNNDNIRKFFLFLMEERTPTTYNNYRTVLKHIFVEAFQLNDNQGAELFQGIKHVKANPKAPQTFSISMINRLKKEISSKQQDLWLVCLLQYYCFIRPGEIRCLKVQDVILEESKIVVDASISKNGKTRYPMIPQVFKDDLEPLLEGRELGEWLCPSTRGVYIQAAKNQYANLHRAILKDIGLDTNRFKLYSWKPTGMLQAVKNGASIKFLKEQAGHHSIDQTDSYLRSVGWFDDDNSSKLFPKI